MLWAMALNRVQDRLDLYFIDVNSGKSQLMMTETTDTWIDMEHAGSRFHILDPATVTYGRAGATGTITSICTVSTTRIRSRGPAKMESH